MAGNLLASFLLLTLLPLGGELYYRFIDDSTDAIGYTKEARRWKERHYVFNHAQARDNVEYEAVIEPGKRRAARLRLSASPASLSKS